MVTTRAGCSPMPATALSRPLQTSLAAAATTLAEATKALAAAKVTPAPELSSNVLWHRNDGGEELEGGVEGESEEEDEEEFDGYELGQTGLNEMSTENMAPELLRLLGRHDEADAAEKRLGRFVGAQGGDS